MNRLVLAITLTISLLSSLPVSAQTEWGDAQGTTRISLNGDALKKLGISVSISESTDDAETLSRTSELMVDQASSIVASPELEIIFSKIRHNGSLSISYGDMTLDVSEINLSVENIPESRLTLFDSETGEDLFDTDELHGAFSTASGQLRYDAADLRITAALAKRLGNEELAGVSIGSLNISADLNVISGATIAPDDRDRPIPFSGPRGVIGPDVIVGDLPSTSNYNSVGGIEAFSVGTTSCNIGDQLLSWVDENNANLHPVIGQNIFRYRALPDGSSRFEHIGQSWLKHGFCALQGNVCPPCTPFGSGCANMLGVGCSDPYGSSLNGSQSGLGPKFQVNPHTGVFASPHFQEGVTGNDIYKRVQVAISDIDPAIVGPAQYFVEGQYVTQDDAAAGNQNNNASYRPLNVTGSGSSWNFSTTGSTQREQPGIRAWQDTRPSVEEVDIQIPGDGLIIAAVEATNLNAGFYHYEYAIQNLNADRGIYRVVIPIPPNAVVQNIGFHDVNYHSGEPYVGTDWAVLVTENSIVWESEKFAINPDANALRWGTLYNFRFDANVEPTTGQIQLDMYKPGVPESVNGTMTVPGSDILIVDCNNNGIDDLDDITNLTSADCNANNIPDECEAPCELTTIEYVSGLSNPIFVTAAPNDDSRLFVVEQFGTIRIVDTATRAILGTPFLDVSGLVSAGGERGLFALAFHPDYANNGLFYISYTNLSGNSVLAQYMVSGNPNVANPGSAVIIRTINQDFANHNGGMIAFGPDGMLYFGLGDGGSADDPLERAQSETSLLGKMLRFDVDNPGGNYIPSDNPTNMTLPEVWAKGLRNPWRFSFDRLNGDMYIGDVGQDAREEINVQPGSSTGGENYGWDCREGDIAAPGNPGDVGCNAAGGGYVDPIYVEAHGQSGTCSITGGYVYRGCDIPGLSGTYFYADYCGDYIRTFRYDGTPVGAANDVTASLQPFSGGNIASIVSFGEDASGELYVVSSLGSIYKIVCNTFTPNLCGNGLLDPGEECEDPDGLTCDCECQVKAPSCGAVFLEDSFDTDQGWTTSVNGATSGGWQRGLIVDTPSWEFDPSSDSDGNGWAFVTENSNSNSDVDNGSVTLTSPVIDTTIGTLSVSYDYFFAVNNNPGDVDRLLVEMTNNGSTWIQVASHAQDTGLQWVSHTILPDELAAFGIVPSATTRIRFTANDSTPQSVVEAGVDAVRICQLEIDDCNVNCIDDAQDIAELTSFDCNENGIPDECETGVSSCDCNGNGIPDSDDILAQTSADCNQNGLPDECDIASQASIDCDGGPIGSPSAGQNTLVSFCSGCHGPDGMGGGTLPGPNIRGRTRDFIWNKLLPPTDHPGGAFVNFTQDDFANIEAFLSDTGARGRPDMIPDECQALQDCDGDSTSDGCELAAETQQDLDFDGIPDDCGQQVCTDPADGDVNDDASTDGRDVQALVGALTGTPTAAEICAADFNNDDSLSLADIPGMVNALLGQ